MSKPKTNKVARTIAALVETEAIAYVNELCERCARGEITDKEVAAESKAFAEREVTRLVKEFMLTADDEVIA